MTNHPHEAELKAFHAELQHVYEKAEDLPPLMSVIKIKAQNEIRKLQNQISGLVGGAVKTHEQPDAGPVKTILGVPVQRPEPVTVERLLPGDEEKKKFLADRDNLYERFLSLKNEQIFTKMKMPGGENVIRAVAKKAGYSDYAEAEINTLYVDAVKKAIQEIKRSEKELEGS